MSNVELNLTDLR